MVYRRKKKIVKIFLLLIPLLFLTLTILPLFQRVSFADNYYSPACQKTVHMQTVLDQAIFKDYDEAKLFAEKKNNAKIIPVRDDCFYVEWQVSEVVDSLADCD